MATCLCEKCLKKRLKQYIDLFVKAFKKGHIANHAPDFVLDGGKAVKGIDYYLEDGRWVFTSWSHLKRGYCCGNGCRHCPYPKVKEK
ncbi:MAG: DUF5522 domain-containing protein [Cyclobacteriaceae bacterium]